MKKFILSSLALCSLTFSQAQTQAPYQGPLTNMKGSEYKFTVVKSLDATAVQNQATQELAGRFLLCHFLKAN